ncbi:MAG: HD domain-containing protein [Bradymonadaceae bacterium]|nr:HD domain-containing protein [Lujinxingiaceae bacterium]
MTDAPELLEQAIAWTQAEMPSGAGHDWNHIERVLKNASALAAEEPGADLLVVRLAAVMHDLVNLPKDHPKRRMASTMSAERAADWLADKLAPERVALVCEAIRCHSFSAGFLPQSLEARIVSDADKLDSLGAIGIARTFECGGQMGRLTLSADDPFCAERSPDDGVYTVDHFYTKLLGLLTLFHTESGRRQAERRLAFMRLYLDTLASEL